jgi:hypothetical protein
MGLYNAGGVAKTVDGTDLGANASYRRRDLIDVIQVDDERFMAISCQRSARSRESGWLSSDEQDTCAVSAQ